MCVDFNAAYLPDPCTPESTHCAPTCLKVKIKLPIKSLNFSDLMLWEEADPQLQQP